MTIREHMAELLHVPLHEMLDWHTWEELGAGSLDVKDMCFQLEDRLGIKVPDEDWDKCHAIGDVVRVAQTYLEKSECTA